MADQTSLIRLQGVTRKSLWSSHGQEQSDLILECLLRTHHVREHVACLSVQVDAPNKAVTTFCQEVNQ